MDIINKFEKKMWQIVNRMPKNLKTSQQIVLGKGDINVVKVELSNGWRVFNYNNAETLGQCLQDVVRDLTGSLPPVGRSDERQYIDITIGGIRFTATTLTYIQDHPDQCSTFDDDFVSSYTDLAKRAIDAVVSQDSTLKGSYMIVEDTADPENCSILTLDEYDNWNEYFEDVRAEVSNSNHYEYHYTQDGMIIYNDGKRSARLTQYNV